MLSPLLPPNAPVDGFEPEPVSLHTPAGAALDESCATGPPISDQLDASLRLLAADPSTPVHVAAWLRRLVSPKSTEPQADPGGPWEYARDEQRNNPGAAQCNCERNATELAGEVRPETRERAGECQKKTE